MLEGIRDNGYLKGIVRRVAHGQADTVYGYRAFIHGDITALRHFLIKGIPERKVIAALGILYVHTGCRLVYVSLYDVSVKRPFIIMLRSTFTSSPTFNKPRLERSRVSFIAVTV